MNDLISRQEALNALGEEPKAEAIGSYKGAFEWGEKVQWIKDRQAIMNAPSVQPVPQKGEWIEIEVWPERYDIFGVKTWASEMQCNQCGFRHTAIQGHMGQYNFCPSCGAYMRGERGDERVHKN